MTVYVETACCFPSCTDAAAGRNRAGQATCAGHRAVVVSGSGVPDAHSLTSGEA